MLNSDLPPVLSIPEVADILKVASGSAYRLVNSGQLPCIRIGRAIRIPRRAILDFLGETP